MAEDTTVNTVDAADEPKRIGFKKELILFLKRMFNLRITMADPKDIHNSIESGAEIHGANMCVLILAIIIASVGLNMNSTAVVIGAMLISPLMGSIMAMGYGLATVDVPMVKKAVSGFAAQIIICILTSTVYFFISPISEASSEILARTSPTIWDVIIAISGGIAGMIGSSRKEKTNLIPGVAIATALMPPLCTVGYGLATAQWSYALGAFYLFFINSFFIALSALIVSKFMRLPVKHYLEKAARRRMFRWIIIVSIVTVIPSILIAVNIVTETILASRYDSYIKTEFSFNETQVVQSAIDEENKTISVALIGATVPDEVINGIDSRKTNYGLEDYSLKVTQTKVSSGMTTEQLQSLIESELNTENDAVTVLMQQEEINELEQRLSEALKKVDDYEKANVDLEAVAKKATEVFPIIESCSIGVHGGWSANSLENSDEFTGKYVLITLMCNSELTEETIGYIKNWLSLETGYERVVIYDSAYAIDDDPEEDMSDTEDIEQDDVVDDDNPDGEVGSAEAEDHAVGENSADSNDNTEVTSE